MKKDRPNFGTITSIVNDPEWQKLRKSLVGTWKINSDENVKKLRNYLGNMSDPLKVKRVHNYLTGSAFRIGIISSTKITKLLNEIKGVWKKIKENN